MGVMLRGMAALFCVVMLTGAGAGIGTPEATSKASVPLSPAEIVDGVSLADWTARWWQWVLAFPPGMQPYMDRDGSLCTDGQRGPVWFLAGTDGHFDAQRTCRMPEEKSLLVPLINMIHFGRISEKDALSCEHLQAEIALNNHHLSSAVAVLDGKLLEAGKIMRLRTARCFDPYGQDHPGEAHDADDQTSSSGTHAAADGYWLPPLPAGRHTLSIGANYAVPGDAGYGSMVQNFQYELDVGEPMI